MLNGLFSILFHFGTSPGLLYQGGTRSWLSLQRTAKPPKWRL